MPSESTRALGQPSDTNPTLGVAGMRLSGAARTRLGETLFAFKRKWAGTSGGKIPTPGSGLLVLAGRILAARGRGVAGLGTESLHPGEPGERKAREHRPSLVLKLFLHLCEDVAALVDVRRDEVLHRRSLQGHELLPEILVELSGVAVELLRLVAHAFLHLGKELHVALEIGAEHPVHGVAVRADELGENIRGEHRHAGGFFLENDLQQYGPRQVLPGLGVHHLELFALDHELLHIDERDVDARPGVVETAVRVFLDQSGGLRHGDPCLVALRVLQCHMILEFAAAFHPACPSRGHAGTLGHVLAAVDGDVRAVYECGLLRTQINDQTRYLLRLAETAERNLRNDFRIEDVLRNRHHHLRPDVAGRDRVDRHSLLRDLERKRFGETMHARFRRRVVCLPESALRSVYRGHVDDPAPAAVDHTVANLLAHVEYGIEIGAKHGVPVRLGHFLEGHVARYAGVVHQYVHRAQIGGHALDAGP